MNSSVTQRVNSTAPDFEAEFERFAFGLVGSSRRTEEAGHRSPGGGSRGPRRSISAEAICRRALELADREGFEALTVRRLAAEMHISTRTLYKRIGSRKALVDEVIRLHALDLPLEFRGADTWEETVRAWCEQLHRALTEHPHLTNAARASDLPTVAAYAAALIEATEHEGIERAAAVECCSSLTELVINDALRRVAAFAMAETSGVADELTLSRSAADAIKLMLRGVRATSPSVTGTAAGGVRREGVR